MSMYHPSGCGERWGWVGGCGWECKLCVFSCSRPDICVFSCLVPGGYSMVVRHNLLPKELARVAACRKTLGLLTCICFLFERYMHSCRIFAISKVAYGWIARTPAACLCKSLWSAVHVGSRHLCMASVWLRAALFGCLLCSWWVLWFGLRPARAPARALDDWLSKHGWTFVSAWTWKHELANAMLDLTGSCLRLACSSLRLVTRGGLGVWSNIAFLIDAMPPV